MCKNFLKQAFNLLLFSLLITGCQKDLKQTLSKQTLHDDATINSARSVKANSCRLIYFDWSTVSTWQFHYNNKGLADEWIIDYGFGYPLHTNNMTYDESDRLIQSREVYFGVESFYYFKYDGKRLINLSRATPEFPEFDVNFRFTYNHKNELIRQDDDLADQHVLMFYDNVGNCTRTDVYFGKDIYFSDNYRYDKPVNNPLLSISGLEIGFPFYGTGNFISKRWFTSNKTVIYDNGVPFIFNDYDPSQTTIETGSHNYPASANYYDQTSKVLISQAFKYETCGGKVIGDAGYLPNKKNNGDNQTSRKRLLLRWGSKKSLQEQMRRFNQQSNVK